MSDAEETRRFFDSIAPRYDRVFARPPEELRANMAQLLDLIGPPCDVLDLGVGSGPELHHLLDAGHRVVGVDISPRMLALCGTRARPIRCVCADFWQGLPSEDAAFDVVIALFGTLAHPPDAAARARLGKDVRRVLRPAGLFYAEIPTEAWAAAHPRFEDAVTHASIDIVAVDALAWREAFSGLDTLVSEHGAEMHVVARKRV